MQKPLDSKKEILSSLKEPHKIISSDEGDPSDEEESKYIETILKEDYNFFQSEYESNHKEDVINKLKTIIQNWSQNIAIKVKKFPESLASRYGAKLYTFGSYRLNVTTNEADIDAVCVVPNFITRDDHFFVDLYEILKNTQRVNEIIPVKNAVVPIIKMIFDNIHIDISYAQLNLEKIDDNLDFMDNNLLKDMDDKSYRSFNGKRVAELILNSVKDNEYNFRLTLRCIKLWAKNKGINSNSMGYLGGVSWAILVAKICQLFPKYKTNRLLEMFFKYYDDWEWENLPVKIEDIKDEKNNPKSPEQWTEKELESYKNKMFVITPAFPCMNSSHNVSNASLSVIKNFFRESNQVLKEIKLKKKNWKDLFKKCDFFNMYKTFIEIDIVANDLTEFKTWLGFVESKIRKLTSNFEWHNNEMPSLADILEFHLYPNPFSRTDKIYNYSKAYFFGVKLKSAQIKNFFKFDFDFYTPVSRFVQIFDENLKDEKSAGINLRIYQIKKSELPESTQENYKEIKGQYERGPDDEKKFIKRKSDVNLSIFEKMNDKKVNIEPRNFDVIKQIIKEKDNNEEDDDDDFLEGILKD